MEQIHDRFYPEIDMCRFLELWKEIAAVVAVPPELIRPTDSFNVELGPVKGLEIHSEMDDLEDAVLHRCLSLGLDSRKINVDTVDDYVKLFCVDK